MAKLSSLVEKAQKKQRDRANELVSNIGTPENLAAAAEIQKKWDASMTKPPASSIARGKVAAVDAMWDRGSQYSGSMPTVAERVGSTISGGLKNTLAGNTNAAGALYQVGQGARTDMNRDLLAEYTANLERAERDLEFMHSENAVKAGSFSERDIQSQKSVVEDLRRKRDAMTQVISDNIQQKATSETYRLADQVALSAQKDIENAKKGATVAGKVLVDVGAAGTQLLGDIATGAVTGVGTMPTMFLRGFGSGAQQARQNGATYEQQLAYGLGTGVVEALSERIASVGNIATKAFGKGALDDITKGVIRAVEDRVKTAAGKQVVNRLASIGVGAAGEGLEEFVAGMVDPLLQRATYSDEKIDWAQVAYDSAYQALIGAVLGGVMGGIGGTDTSAVKAPENKTKKTAETAVSPAAAPEVQQVQAQAEVTQSQNPEAEVLDAATTLFTQQGMNLKTAQTRAEIVGKLIRGEEVSDKDLNRLDPTSNQTKQIFTQLTGVQFPEGKIQIEQLRNIYRSAHEVAQVAKTQIAEAAATTVAENARVESPLTDEQILARAKEARTRANPDADKKAAQILAQTRGEIAPDGNALLSFKDFRARHQQKVPDATREESARLYDMYLNDNQTISFMGRRMTRQQVLNTLNSAPGVERLTAEERAQVEADLNEKFDRELEAQKRDGKDAAEHSDRRRRAEKREKVQRSVNDWKKVLIKNSSVKDIVLDESLEENEAAFITPDGVIHLNAKRMTSEADVAYVLGHELVHSIDDSTARKTMVNDIIETVRKITEPTESREDAIERYRKMYQEHENQVAARANREAKTISFEYAEEEYAADLMREVFLSGDMLNKLAAEKPSLMARIQEILQKWIASLKGNNEAVELYNELTALQDRFVKALQTDAAQQKLALENAGIEVDADTNSARHDRYSLDTWLESDYMTDPENAAKALAKAIGVSDEKAAKYIKDVNGVAKLIADDKTLLDYNAAPGMSSFVSNTEYGGSVDFSTICKKRRLFTGTFTAIQKALPNTALTSDEMIDIRKRMKNAGHEVSCGLCYVEGSRLNLGQYATEFLDKYTAEDHEFVPAIADLTTVEGQENLRLEHPDVYEAYIKYLNSLAQRKPKVYQTATAYDGEILKKFGKDTKVEEKNKNGGLRLQSFSDFEIIHLIDNMQVIMDMARVGLAGQAYTKVPDFAWAMGNTGLKINLSLIAKDVDADGHLVFDDVEGMPHAEAKKLRDAYSDNVGTIIVVFNDAQLKAAMADDFIDYIIPFHRSQLNQKQYDGLGLPKGTKNYTMVQNESYIEPVLNKNGKKTRPDNYMPNTYWDFNKSGKENAEAYLKMCAENNRRPKFSNVLEYNGDGSYSLPADGSADGYWKLLIDFKMYNNDGVGVPQQPVKPDFNIDEANRMLSEYKGGHSNFPVAQDIVEEFVADYKKNHPDVRYSVIFEGSQNTKANMTLAEAERLALKNTSPSVIRRLTGWWKDPTSGEWAFEIDDSKMQWKISDTKGLIPRAGVYLEDIISHDELFESYPHLRSYKVFFKLNPTPKGGEGTIVGRNRQIWLERDADLNNPEVKKALLHEVQHAIQYYERDLGRNLQAGFSPAFGYQVAFIEAYNQIKDTDAFKRLKTYRSRSNYIENQLAKNAKQQSQSSFPRKSDVIVEAASSLYANSATEQIAEATANRYDMDEIDRWVHPFDAPGVDANTFDDRDVSGEFNNLLSLLGSKDVDKDLPKVYARLKKEGALREKVQTGSENRAVELDQGRNLVVDNNVSEVRASEKSGASSLPETKYSIVDSTYAPTFYSKMEHVVDAVKQEKLGAASVVPMLKGKGVKDEEIKWSGIEEWLDGKKSVTKQELLEFVRGSQLEIQEIVLDGSESHVSEEANSAVEDARLAIHNTQIRLRELNAADLFDDGRYDDTDSYFDGWTVRTAANKRISAAFKERLSEDYKFLPDVLPVDTLLEFATTRVQNDAWADQVREWLETDEGKRLTEIRQLGEDLREQHEELDRAFAVAQREARQSEPRWADYKLPGGENYREYLFRLPNIPYNNSAMDVHWGGRDSILAHARVQDIKADAGKMLFIEEIQSDWHNEGHQFGYKDTAASERAMEERQEAEAVMREMRRQILPDLEEFYRERGLDTPERAAETHLDMHYNNQLVDIFNKTYDFPETLQKQLNQYFELDRQAVDAHKRERALRRGVPDAPFRKNYHEFVLKNLIRKAAEGGYDSIGWTPGKMQEERWSSDYAEGYRIEYDQDIPKFLNKYGKQWGAKVGKTVVGNRDYAVETDSSVDMDDDSWLLGEGIHIDGDEVWSMPITDEMKQSVLYEGQARYSITPQFEQWYKETYGEDVSTAHLKRRLKTAERRAAEAEHDLKAAELKNTIDSEMDLTAWMIHHTKKMREQKRVMSTKLDEARKAKAEAVRTAVSETKVVERAKAEVQHDADRMAERRNAAKRLRVREDAYKQKVTEMKENQKLKRNAAKATLRDSKLAAKRRAEIEAEQGVVDTIRKNPKQRTTVEKLQETAQNLRTLGRTAYRNFVNQAAAIDAFSKRQAEGMRAGTLVNIVGGTASTVESTFKTGLVDRSGNRIGDSMSDVFLCWDEKHKKVNEGQQALLQDFMLHWHNIDRMSIVARAESALETFELNHEWLRDMDPKEFARLTAMTEKELEKNGQYEAQQLAFQYHKLLRDYTEAANKPIFADDKGNSVTAETSQRIVDQYLEEHPWLLEKANGIYEWWDRFMREWAVGDTISEAEYERMHTMYPHYVPTYRADKNGVGGANFVGAGGATVSKAVKKAKGSHSEVMNIEDSFSNIVSKIIRLNRVNELYMNIIDTAMLDNDGLFSDMAYFDWDSSWQSGEYGNALLDGELTETVEDAVTAGLEKVGSDYKLTGWMNGRRYTTLISEELYKSIGNVTGHLANDMEEGLLKAGNFLTSPMKTAITGINPSFAVRNLSRDLPTAIINSISGLKFPKYYAQAAKEIAKNSEHWQQFQALGGTHATYYNDNQGYAKAMSRRQNPASWTVGKLGAFNEVTEAQTRFAEYLATIDRLGDTYENRLQGIKNAAEVTVDFSRKGRYGKVINAWVPYWNPAVQGIDKTIRSVIDSPDGSAVWKQASKTLSRAALTTVLVEAVLYGVLEALDRDDEWEELNDRTKAAYYCIPLKDSKTFLKIPKNREWGAILGTPFMHLLEWANGRENPFENYIETSIEPNFLPPAIFRPDAGGGFTSDVIGFSQMNDLSKNEDFAGRTIVPYSYQQGTLSQQYDNETSNWSKRLGKLFNWSPMQIDYIIGDYFGDFGDMFIQATSEARKQGEQNLGEAALDILTSPFLADARYSNYAVNKYYDLTTELGKVVQDKKNQLGTDAAKETIEYQTDKALDEMFGKQITELNRYVRDLPDGDEKDAVKEQIAQLAKDAIEFYEDSMAGKVNNPIRTAEYHDFSETVSKELIRMDAFSGDYKFTPTGNPSSKYTDPNDKNREYVLTDEQKDYFKQLYREKYNEIFEDLIQSSKYKKKKDSEKAELLEDTRDDVLDATKEEFFEWLDDTGVRSTKKQK